jgi:uncharacterized RDD family membrane protein YckC
MDIWKILEIEPTNDIREIKQAYAKKLKMTRPDEDPAAFQMLHFAYKNALEIALYSEENTNQSNPAPHSGTEYSTDQNQSLEIISNTEIDYENEKLETDRLLNQSRLLFNSNGSQRTPKYWEFLLDSPYILYGHYNWNLGIEILKLIQEKNINPDLSKQIGISSLNYLNSIFNWNENKHQILHLLGNNYAQWFEKLNNQHNEGSINPQKLIRGGGKLTISVTGPKTAHIIKRLLAWLIDISLITSLIFMLSAVFSLYLDFNIPIIYRNYCFIAFMFLYFWFFESSYIQATIGKIIFNIKVVDQLNERITIGQGLTRSAIFTSSILFKTCILTFIIDNEKLLALIIPLSFAINLLTLILDDERVDSSSNTKVINS